MQPDLGYYRHFKGNVYQVIGVGKFTEKLADHDGLLDVVVYRAMYSTEEHGFGAIWVRPLAMWWEPAELQGRPVPRFVKLSDEEAKAALPTQKV